MLKHETMGLGDEALVLCCALITTVVRFLMKVIK